MGAALGALFAWLWLRGRLQVAEARLAAEGEAGLRFQSAADAALRSSQGAFLDAARTTLETVRAQMAEDLGRLERQVKEVEETRLHAFGGLREQLRYLERETSLLSSALRAPNARGRWGEITLRRVAELAGMVKHCDFLEQSTGEANGVRLRPDMIVRLPGGRTLVVDAKAPLAGYLEAIGAAGEAARREALERYAQQVSRQVDHLAAKQYWQQFDSAPELVVLFLPGDHFLAAALEVSPALLENALERGVLVATPITLISVLRASALGWRQQQLAENAAEIRKLAADLYGRMQAFLTHHAETGRELQRVTEAYNRSVGSLESRLLPSLRRIRELGAGGEEPLAPEPVDVAVRAAAFR